MRFSLRSLMFFTSIACATLAWVEFDDIYRYFWPNWRFMTGLVLIATAHCVNRHMALPIAIGSLLFFIWADVRDLYRGVFMCHSSDGILVGKRWFIEHVCRASAAAVVMPALALLCMTRLAVRDHKCFAPVHQALLATLCVISALDLVAHIYLMNYYAAGW